MGKKDLKETLGSHFLLHFLYRDPIQNINNNFKFFLRYRFCHLKLKTLNLKGILYWVIKKIQIAFVIDFSFNKILRRFRRLSWGRI